MESKRAIVDALFDLLKCCEAFRRIESLTYEESNGDEFVVAIFKNPNNPELKWQYKIDVTADSGCALIHDVYERLYKEMV